MSTGITSSGIFLSTSNVSGLALNWHTHTVSGKPTRDREQLDAAVKQHTVEKSVFGVNLLDVSESVDALQRAIVVVLCALRCKWYGFVAETVQD